MESISIPANRRFLRTPILLLTQTKVNNLVYLKQVKTSPYRIDDDGNYWYIKGCAEPPNPGVNCSP